MTKGQESSLGVSSWKPIVHMTAVGLLLGSNIAMAQVSQITPPLYSPLDKNGINLSTAQFQKSSALLSLGNPDFSGIAITEQWYGWKGIPSALPPVTNSFTQFLSQIDVSGYIVAWTAVYNGKPYTFPAAGGTGGDGASSLSVDTATGVFTMTTPDGTIVQYNAYAAPSAPTYNGTPVVTQVTEPNGRVTNFVYKPGCTIAFCPYGFWLVSATNNLGYQIRVTDVAVNPGVSVSYRITALQGINGSIDYAYCDPVALTCSSLSHVWPTVNYTYTTDSNNNPTLVTVTEPTNAVTSYTIAGGFLTSIKTPESSSNNILIRYNSGNGGNGFVTSYSDNDGSYSYAFGTALSGGITKTSGTISGPNGYHHTVTGDYFSGFLLTDKDSLGNTTSYTEDSSNRVTKIVRPEGNSENWTYDARSNIIAYWTVSKTGTVSPSVTANYDATCTNPVTCNKPHWIKDALGNETDFQWDPTHGGLVTVTKPAVQVSGTGSLIHPQTHYSYAQRYAWLKNSSGGYSQAASPVWVKTEEVTCRNSQMTSSYTCPNGDQVVTDYDYGPNSGPNNLLLHGVAVTADGQTRRSCFAYDAYGNKISETKPRANLAACP
jgi:hypothetical protein